MDESVALKFVTLQNDNRYEYLTRGSAIFDSSGSVTFTFAADAKQNMRITVSREGKKATVTHLGQGGYTAVIEEDCVHKLILPHGLQADVICNRLLFKKTAAQMYLMADYFFAELGENSRTKLFLTCTY